MIRAGKSWRPLHPDSPEILHTVSYGLVGKDIARFKVDAVRLQDLDGSVGETALGEHFISLHEEHHGVLGHHVLNALLRPVDR